MPRKSSAKPPREEKQESSKQASAKIHQFPRRPAKSEPLSEPEPPFMKRRLSKPGLDTEMEPQPRFEAPTYKPAGKLVGKVALITGGDSGIGRAVAVLYAREGADVAIMYLPQEQSDAEQVRAMVEREGRRCLLLPGDVTDPDFCREAVERTVSELGQLDVLVNNAAFQTSQEKLEDLGEDQWEHTFRTNIFGYFYMVKAAMPHLKPGSAIVNTGSITGLRVNRQLLDYSSTTGAVHAFTKSLAQNLADRKIRVNCVAPGPIWTPLVASDFEPQDISEHGANTPYQRAGQPEEVAPSYVFFASEADSSYITGEVLALLGGQTTAG